MPVCFDIGGTNIRSGWADQSGIVQIKQQSATPHHCLETLLKTIVTMVRSAPLEEQDYVAISITGFVDPGSNELIIANIPCLKQQNLSSLLTSRLNMPVVMANDADCLALAEAHVGVAKKERNVFAIILGTGVGGAMVINGELVTGFGGISGEWGHGPIVDPSAGGLVESMGYFPCGCGQQGCLDTVGAARGMENVHKALTGSFMEAEQIINNWREGASQASKTVDVCSEMVARALSVIVNVVGPGIVPVGGGLANAEDFIKKIDKKVRSMTLADYPKPLVVQAQYLENAGLVGAAFLNAKKVID
ncbi:ROK family protein [Gilvimarinus chinensis]|uniref:ROK family protein n=1 Tax=Gilvimarinus chinensis TaxID=396005 RepID=UPI00037A6BB9|nr:ROK family protein [Gilvimarinus chinensis]